MNKKRELMAAVTTQTKASGSIVLNEYNMYNLLKDTTDLEKAKNIIQLNLSNVENSIDKTLQEVNYKLPFTLNFGLNYFPQKEYKGIIYEEGYYESLVVTLGSGKGNNWWCVLFPPLCLLESKDSNIDEVEYQFFVKNNLEHTMSLQLQKSLN